MVAGPVDAKVILEKGLVMDFENLKNEIKERVDIAELVESSGVHLKKSGKLYMGLCPFHEDKNPSLAVYPETGSWYCFGCSKGGDVFSWVMEYEGVDFKEAVEKLAEKAGIDIASKKEKVKKEKGNKRPGKRQRNREKRREGAAVGDLQAGGEGVCKEYGEAF